MPNGNILAAVWEVIPHSEVIAEGRNPIYLGHVSGLWSAKVEELRPIGTDSAEVVWSWRLWDHMIQDFDPTKPGYGTVADHPELFNLNYINPAIQPDTMMDFVHLNQVTYNPDLDQVMLSSHNTDEIWIIDHSTTTAQAATHSGGVHNKGGDFLYRWGNPAAYNMGTSADNKLFQQHDPEWITTGKYAGQIMIFNNGKGRAPVSLSDYSSVDIIAPPVTPTGDYTIAPGMPYGPDTLSWSYYGGLFYSMYEGGAQMLSNGNVLICNALAGTFFEVDSDKNIVWKYISPINNGHAMSQGATPANNTVYRCLFYPSSYTGFAGRSVTPGTPLEQHPLVYSCSVTESVPRTIPGKLTVFPNPAETKITIDYNDLSSAILCDMTGRVVAEANYNSASQGALDVSALPDGVYILTINNHDHSRIVVKH